MDASFYLVNPNAIKEMGKDIQKRVTNATVKTFNEIAYNARGFIVTAEKNTFIIRNHFVESQTQFTKSKAYNAKSLKEIKSITGITTKANFMEMQDAGGVHKNKRGVLSIHTDTARGGNKSNVIKRGLRMDKIQKKVLRGSFSNRGSGASNRIAMAAAAYKQKKLIHFGKSLFEVTSFYSGKFGAAFNKRLVVDRAHTRATIKAQNFFKPECEKAANEIQKIFNDKMG